MSCNPAGRNVSFHGGCVKTEKRSVHVRTFHSFRDVWCLKERWCLQLLLSSSLISDQAQARQFQLQSCVEDLLEPDGPRSLTSSVEFKNTGLAAPRAALGEQRATGPPISFPCPSQACQRRAKPKKSDLQWLLDRLSLKQCGNYGWQEGRCVVERRGHGRRNHPLPEALKEPQRN